MNACSELLFFSAGIRERYLATHAVSNLFGGDSKQNMLAWQAFVTGRTNRIALIPICATWIWERCMY